MVLQIGVPLVNIVVASSQMTDDVWSWTSDPPNLGTTHTYTQVLCLLYISVLSPIAV